MKYTYQNRGVSQRTMTLTPLNTTDMIISYENLLQSYVELEQADASCKEIVDVMRSLDESMCIIKAYGAEGVKCLNVYDKALEDLTGVDEKLISASKAIEALDGQKKSLWQRFIDGCKWLWQKIKDFFGKLFNRNKEVVQKAKTGVAEVKNQNKVDDLLDKPDSRVPFSHDEFEEFEKVSEKFNKELQDLLGKATTIVNIMREASHNGSAEDAVRKLQEINDTYGEAFRQKRKEVIDFKAVLVEMRGTWNSDRIKGKSLRELGYTSMADVERCLSYAESSQQLNVRLSTQINKITDDLDDALDVIWKHIRENELKAQGRHSSESFAAPSMEGDSLVGTYAGWAALSAPPAVLYTVMAGLKEGLIAYGIALAAPIALAAAIGVVAGTVVAADYISSKITGVKSDDE